MIKIKYILFLLVILITNFYSQSYDTNTTASGLNILLQKVVVLRLKLVRKLKSIIQES